MKVCVYVMLKNGVLDLQGEVVKYVLGFLGFDGVDGVCQGKVIEFDLVEGSIEDMVNEMCEKFLVNIVIESYCVEIF